MARAAVPGAIISLIAFVLLLLCALSTPIIKPIYYLEARVNSNQNIGTSVTGDVKFGITGYCSSGVGVESLIGSSAPVGDGCSSPKIGYNPNLNEILGVNIINEDKTNMIFKALTAVTSLVIASACLALLCFVSSLFAVMCSSRFWEIMSFIWSLLATIVTWVSWIINIVIFALAKKRLADYSSNTLGASYGPALWMHLAGAIVLLVAVCFTGFGMCGTYSRASRRDRRAAAHQQDAVYTEKPIGTRRHFWQRRQKGNLGTY